MIKVLIADDQTLMRDGLKTILDLEEDIEVIATAENGEIAFQKSIELTPDVILMDIRMPIMNGVDSVKKIKSILPKVAVIMLTTFDDDEYIIEALSNGASGYLLKDMPAEKLIEAIRDSLKGQLFIPTNIAAKLISRLYEKEASKNTLKRDLSLSERELQVSSLLIEGYNNKQISSKLFISEGTVKNYISNIYSKIGISDRTKAALFLKANL
ncbi:response regulator transcription factor [Clostridium algidicarnis]|uniref:Stage 0 sporulation protein A homolog n=2 Tax=Clostridium algidicarnis TaxID=37659 RepID=A0A2S6FVP0_9CLOT|nr:response regulator transcription factor [Clostridium algidicarnis]MBB6631711.1 response regulator transcription factor [Clostridium algidicarnis]MBB6697252.1 response regulator transcription factor [Clostridium algidicarnis]MBU3194385.1 response regulator transcription factor [Clostridium algidicarnis]MBU3206351.1 response regulator transcription factor [Clostridium algidicarnis]MBU3219992.1 response regulator transcription factor [Clostridium algidicarnis]